MAEFNLGQCQSEHLGDDLAQMIVHGQQDAAKKLFDDCIGTRSLSAALKEAQGNDTKDQIKAQFRAAELSGDVSKELNDDVQVALTKLGFKGSTHLLDDSRTMTEPT